MFLSTSAVITSAVLIAQVFLGATPSPIGVRLTSEVAECPSAAQVASALRQVLGDDDRSAGGWILAYGRDPSAPEAARDLSLWMELIDPTGKRLVMRKISASPGECAAIASAMTAVVERSLRTLGWTRGDPLPESARRSNVAQPKAAPARTPPPRLVLGMGPSLGSTPRTGTNLLLEARLRVTGPLFLRVGGGLFASSDSQNVGTGKAFITSRTFTAAPLLVFALGSVEIAGGPALLLSFDHGNTEGLAVVGSGDRQVLALGIGIGVAARLSPRWRLSLGLEGFHAELGAHYVVEVGGARTVVLSPAAWEGVVSAKLEFVAWP